MTQTLPILQYIDTICQTLSQKNILILEAAPGAGKTTQVPKALLKTFQKKIIVLEPRRLAAKMSAERVANELNEPCGEQVGYHIRFEHKKSNATRLTYMTEGVFLRKLQSSQDLSDIDCIILDEFHERSLNSDVILMLLRRRQNQGSHIKLLLMSATLDSAFLQSKLKAPLISVPGTTFPVDIEYHGSQMLNVDPKNIQKACQNMLQDTRCRGHILVFLPGARDIQETFSLLSKSLKDIRICKLYADLSKAEQKLAFEKSDQRKIILTTNVAETSLTIPGVTGVIDTGLAKVSGYTHWSGMPTLSVQKISQAAMVQRAGRAGRTEKGVVYRLCSKDEFLRRPAHTPIDIETQDLTGTLLSIYDLNLSINERQNISTQLPWIEAPNHLRLQHAKDLLHRLNLIQDQYLTDFGETVIKYPFHPRIAAIAAAGENTPHASDALLAACIIQERGLTRQPYRTRSACDITYQMDSIKNILDQDDKWPIEESNVKHLKKIFKQCANSMSHPCQWPQNPTDQNVLATFILRGFVDRVAKRQIQKSKKKHAKSVTQYRYHFCLGRGGVLHNRSSVSHPEFLIAIDAMEEEKKDAAKGTLITLASSITSEQLKNITSMLSSSSTETIDPKTGSHMTTTILSYGQWELETQHIEQKQWTHEQLSTWLSEQWPGPFDLSILKSYHHRVELIKKHVDIELPYFQGEWLNILQSMICENCTSPSDLTPSILKAKIFESLSWEEGQTLQKWTPENIKTKNGLTFQVLYTDRGPMVKGRIQDFYGLTQTPCILDGRLPLTLDILQPNDRTCQMTSNLEGFWTQHFPSIRTELQRRYPRHHWSENPATALPIRLKSKCSPT